MRKFLTVELFERLFFTAIVVGISMLLLTALRFADLSRQLADNEMVQIRRGLCPLVPSNILERFQWEWTLQVSVGIPCDEKAPLENNSGGGLIAADMERRRLVEERFNMMVVGGVGLVLVGLGWLATDVTRTRRRKAEAATADDAHSQTWGH